MIRSVFLILLLLLMGPLFAQEGVYRHPQSGLEFPQVLSWKTPAETLQRGPSFSAAEGRVSIPYSGSDLALTVNLYAPHNSIEEDFAHCRQLMTASIISTQTLLDEKPWTLPKKNLKVWQATYTCGGWTSDKYTQMLMFEVSKTVRCKCRISSARDTRPVARAFLRFLKL